MRPAGRVLTADSCGLLPPKTADMQEPLRRSIVMLAPLARGFVTVTYGAGGSTHERSHDTVKRMVEQTRLNPAAHLTCVATSQNEIPEVAHEYCDPGVRQARRPARRSAGRCRYDRHAASSWFPLRRRRGRCAPEALRLLGERCGLPADVPAGELSRCRRRQPQTKGRRRRHANDHAVLFRDSFLRLPEGTRADGLTIPIVPGFMLTTDFAQAYRFCGMSGAKVPSSMAGHLDGLNDGPDKRMCFAATLAAERDAKPVDHGMANLQWCTISRTDFTCASCHILGLRPQPAQVPA